MAGRGEAGVRRTIAAVVAAMAMATVLAVAQPEADATAPTIVTLTFDDGHTSHDALITPLQSRGMAGTFYVNSAKLGSSSYYMTWDDVRALADAGNEIGGHTLDHARLTRVSTTEAQRQVCADRASLQQHGFAAASFAYPYGDVNSSVESIVQACGYTSGRALGGVKSGTVCRSCPLAETMPPRDPFEVRTLRHATPTTKLAELQEYVTQAERSGGGWVVLVFHGICDDRCTGSYSFSSTAFAQFLDWLQPRAAQVTSVRTVGDVMALTGTA